MSVSLDVCSPGGMLCTLKADRAWSVWQIKKIIAKQTGMPVSRQRLLQGQREWTEFSMTLGDVLGDVLEETQNHVVLTMVKTQDEDLSFQEYINPDGWASDIEHYLIREGHCSAAGFAHMDGGWLFAAQSKDPAKDDYGWDSLQINDHTENILRPDGSGGDDDTEKIKIQENACLQSVAETRAKPVGGFWLGGKEYRNAGWMGAVGADVRDCAVLEHKDEVRIIHCPRVQLDPDRPTWQDGCWVASSRSIIVVGVYENTGRWESKRAVHDYAWWLLQQGW